MSRFGIVVLLATIAAAPAVADLTWYTTQASFEAANSGNTLAGFEDYEASIQDPGRATLLADPLRFGVANGVYPNGTQGYEGLITQANQGGAKPDKIDPRGADGLVAASVGLQGATSDVVFAQILPNSLDLIFLDGHVGIGGNVLDFIGNQTGVNVRVYDIDNIFLGEMSGPADTSGKHFMGMISDGAEIGRVNIFSLGKDNSEFGAEGMDNVQAYMTPEPASLSLFVLGGLALLRRRR